MIKIAIVDDMISECNTLRELLIQYEIQQHIPIDILEFHSGQEILKDYQAGSFDVVFMDIFLNLENGVDCALELRQVDDQVNIIFLTTSSEFGVKSYDVRATDYIIKPATLDTLSRAIQYCKIPALEQELTICVTTKHQPLEVSINRILYADFQKRRTFLHLEGCLVPVSGSFKELSNQLTIYPQFIVCFKGIVINIKKIREVVGSCVVLTNGEQLPISRRMQRQVEQQRLHLSIGSLRREF